jgi:tetratricopeptide (TPR) repeat protein
MFKIITLPFDRSVRGFDEDLLNSFVVNKQLKYYRAEIFHDGGETYWTVFLEYDPLVDRPAEKENMRLDEPQRLLYDRLRAWRKEIAENAGVPVYISSSHAPAWERIRGCGTETRGIVRTGCLAMGPTFPRGTVGTRGRETVGTRIYSDDGWSSGGTRPKAHLRTVGEIEPMKGGKGMKARELAGMVVMMCGLVAGVGPVWADNCPLGKELAAKSMEVFKKDQKRGLAGLIQAQKYCPEDAGIAYNLGLAYYQYKRPDLAYQTWVGLAEKRSKDAALLTNLGWLALELDKVNEAASWAEKARKVSESDENVSTLSLDVLFRQGKYRDALVFAQSHKNALPKDKLTSAADYVAEEQWNVFRGGQKERAAQEMMKLSREYPDMAAFERAKEKMFAALLDDSADVPLPKPLPDRKSGGGGGYVSPESDVLNLRSAKGVLKPRDNAYALVVGIRNYKQLSGPRFADHDARQVQRMLCNLAGFRNDPGHIRLKLNQDATIGSLYGDLHWLLQKARLDPKATVVFYFSGHGSPVLEDDRNTVKDGLLVPYEANLDNLNDRTAVPLSYLRKELGKLKNPQVVCMIDACFSGSGKSVSGMKLIKPKVNTDLLASEKLFISAAAADRPAEEYTPGQQGAFSYFFLKGLMGDADQNDNGWVDTLEAYTYARDKLEALGLEQDPQMNRPDAIPLTKVR